ncbi:MAG: head maturation protease, ClpP-related [Reyranella sp.]
MQNRRNALVIASGAKPLGFTAFKGVPCKYRATAKAGRGELDLYGIIGADWFGDGITSKMVSDSLKAMGSVSSIEVNINSPGGDVFEGRGIYNLLKEHKAKVDVHVIAEAASAASLIAMAGDTITMSEGSLMMIHRASGLAYGNAEEIEQLIKLLKTIDETMVSTYAARTKNSPEDVRAWLDAETWMTADEAVARGFADKAEAAAKVAALSIDRRILGFKHIPETLRPNRARALKLIAGGKTAA